MTSQAFFDTERGLLSWEGEDVLARFGGNLRRGRQARKLSQAALAERACINRAQISLFETGQRQPLLETLIKLAAALEVPVQMLIEGTVFVSTSGGGELRVSPPPELPRFTAADTFTQYHCPPT